VSLILEALRKLEREKPATDRGIVVMTTAGLAAEKRGVPPWVLLAAGLAAGLGIAFFVIERRGVGPSVPPPTTLAAPAVVPSDSPTLPSVSSSAPRPPAALPGPATSLRAPQSMQSAPPSSMRPSSTEPAAAEISPTVPLASLARPPRAAASPKPSATSALVLQAISTRDGQPVALINDRVLREGDSVDGVRIVRIGDAEVEIEKGGVRSVLRF
jgi:hypothetical protein